MRTEIMPVLSSRLLGVIELLSHELPRLREEIRDYVKRAQRRPERGEPRQAHCLRGFSTDFPTRRLQSKQILFR